MGGQEVLLPATFKRFKTMVSCLSRWVLFAAPVLSKTERPVGVVDPLLQRENNFDQTSYPRAHLLRELIAERRRSSRSHSSAGPPDGSDNSWTEISSSADVVDGAVRDGSDPAAANPNDPFNNVTTIVNPSAAHNVASGGSGPIMQTAPLYTPPGVHVAHSSQPGARSQTVDPTGETTTSTVPPHNPGTKLQVGATKNANEPSTVASPNAQVGPKQGGKAENSDSYQLADDPNMHEARVMALWSASQSRKIMQVG